MDINQLQGETLKKYLEYEIFKYQAPIEKMKVGINYYYDKHDINNKLRKGFGEDGKEYVITNLPNSRILDNRYSFVVDQKINYLMSKPPKMEKNAPLADLFDTRFMRTMTAIGRDIYNCGIGWLYVYLKDGEVKFMRLNPLEVIPIWKDANHDGLDGVIHIVSKRELIGSQFQEKRYVKFYTDSVIKTYDYTDGTLVELKDREEVYLTRDDKGFNLDMIPFVYFKNPQEKPLIYRVKGLQDALNTMMSNFTDNMLEDPYNTILVVKNYDGERTENFRAKLTKSGVIKVRTVGNAPGDVDSLEVKVNAENYKLIIDLLRKGIIENARGVDAKNDKSMATMNEMNIQSMYTDIELDANMLELELQASFEYLQEVMQRLLNATWEVVTVKFTRNIMVNDGEIIDNLAKSDISMYTKLQKHPYVEDADEEMARMNEEEEKAQERADNYSGDFLPRSLSKAVEDGKEKPEE